MRILFIHQNAPGQFRHLAPHLAANGANEVVFLGERTPTIKNGVRWVQYNPPRPPGRDTHHYLKKMEASLRRGQEVVRTCLELRRDGFTPDVVVAHSGWGETMFLREALPRTRILNYCEMFYRSEGQDTGFLPELDIGFDGRCRLRTWNADLLAGLEIMDRGVSPTWWQRQQHPAAFQPEIAVLHEGVDTTLVTPSPLARLRLPNGRVLSAEDEVVTFVARNLEPVRGFASLMRSLPALLRLRPRVEVVICGEDGTSYGAPPPQGGTWRQAFAAEASIDEARVHFVGRLTRPSYLALLQISALHLYLTVPFVLSWSCVEAMSAGCLVLGSDVAPVREVIKEGVTGALVDMRDPAAVAIRAAGLLAERAGWNRVRATARALALERFDLSRCLAAQTRLVREVAQ